MDWNSITTHAQAQGTVFWVASAAVSVGLTLLVVALVQAARQRLGRSQRQAGATTPTVAAVAPVTARQATAAYAEHAGPEDIEAPAPPSIDEDGALVMMLRRLQQAGDRLEEIAADRESAPSMASASALKSGFQDVEYVFRASSS